jgi:hypothetical protein
MATTTAVQFAAGTAIELQKRSRSNGFLDEINTQLLKPRGLFAFVMALDPSKTPAAGKRDVNIAEMVRRFDRSPAHNPEDTHATAAASSSSFSMDKVTNSIKSLRIKSGTAGEYEMPESAELIYPDIDAALNQASDEAAAASSDPTQQNEAFAAKVKTKFSHASNFVASYADRRAQAEYAAAFPGSQLAKGPKPKFTSRLADPTHPAQSGGLISLLTGGFVDQGSKRRARRERKTVRREAKNDRRVAHGRRPRKVRQRDATGQIIKQRKGIVGRILLEVCCFLERC